MKRLTWLIVALLLVFSLACGGSDDKGKETAPAPTSAPAATKAPEGKTDKPAATKAPEPTKEPEPTEMPEPTEAPEVDAGEFYVDAEAMSALSSYRAETEMTFAAKDDSSDGSVMLVQEVSTDPAAHHILMSISGTFPGTGEMTEMAEGGTFEIEIYLVGDKQYMRFGDMWMSADAGSENAVDPSSFGDFTSFIKPEDLNDLKDEKDLKFVGKEEVNGLQTRHYHADYSPAWGGMFSSNEDIESGSADIWIASEDDFAGLLVGMSFEVVGKLELDSETGEKVDGTMTVNMNLTDINEPLTIEVPEEATASGVPEDVPAYPNADEVNALGGIIAMTTTDDVDAVNEFYNGALEEAGWTKTEESILGTNWEKDDRSLSLMVTHDDEENITNILIMINTGEE